MWKFITSGPQVLRRRLRAVLAAAALMLMTSAPSHAAVEYVRVCSLYGAGFFYIPGTDTCVNANQILTNQMALARRADPRRDGLGHGDVSGQSLAA